MNRKQHSVVLASLLALALAGCSSTRGTSDEMSSGATASGTGGSSSSSSSGTSGMAGTSDSSGTAQSSGTSPATSTADTAASSMPDQSQMPGASGQASMPSAPPNAVVMTIEPMPHAGGSAAMGTSGTSGATGSSSTGDQAAYRITLRMDDGTTRVVTQDKAPTFRNGDRVNLMNDTITK